MREIAHFFWHGELSKLETSCIQSFVRHGFKVNLWSFTNLSLPGVISQDAREILPEEKLKLYKNNKTYKPSLAIFASVFRYNLLSKKGGWWFDTDCYCLKNQKEFKNLRSDYSFVAGQQQSLIMPHAINNAVMFSTKEVGNTLLNNINLVLDFYKDNLLPWGRIGPSFITDLNRTNSISQKCCILPIYYFYSINWVYHNIFTEPTKLKLGQRNIKNSYVSHIWDNYFLENNIDKNNPPLGSLLEKMYNQEI